MELSGKLTQKGQFLVESKVGPLDNSPCETLGKNDEVSQVGVSGELTLK